MGKRVAIVGAGCSGIGALWALKTGTEDEVHLFEASSRLGGHNNTVTYEGPNGQKVNVDTGLMVMTAATYPNFFRFLKEVGVATKKTELNFGLSRDRGTFEWANTSWSSVFAQKSNILSPSMWSLIFETIRFNEFALDLLEQELSSYKGPVAGQSKKNGTFSGYESIGEYLDREVYSQEFRDSYLIPLTAAIGSVGLDVISLEIPAITLVRFLYDHQLLDTVANSGEWLTIPGGSKQYIDAVMKGSPPERLHLNSKVTALTPTKRGSVILTANERDHEFDHVILATHGDQALDILRPVASRQEVEVLGGFHTYRTVAVLHSDLSLMPKRRQAWSACNYITESPFPPTQDTNASKASLTYWMNSIQSISEEEFGPVLVTLNPLHVPDPKLAQGIWEYSHPHRDARARRSQQLLPKIQNIRSISYCGAWTRNGSHEDGFSSGLSVAINHLGAKLPFEFVDSRLSRTKKPTLTIKNYLLRLTILLVQIFWLLTERAWYAMVGLVDRRIVSRRKKA